MIIKQRITVTITAKIRPAHSPATPDHFRAKLTDSKGIGLNITSENWESFRKQIIDYVTMNI